MLASLACVLLLQTAFAQPCSEDAASVEVVNGLREWMNSTNFESFAYQEGANLLLKGGFRKSCRALHNFMRKPSMFQRHAGYLSKDLERQLAKDRALVIATQVKARRDYYRKAQNVLQSMEHVALRLNRLISHAVELGAEALGIVVGITESIAGLVRWCGNSPYCRRVVFGALCLTAKEIAVEIRAKPVHVYAAALTFAPASLKAGYWVREWLDGRVGAAEAVLESGAAAAEMLGTLGGGTVAIGAAIVLGLTPTAVVASYIVGAAAGAWTAHMWEPWVRRFLSVLLDQNGTTDPAAAWSLPFNPSDNNWDRIQDLLRCAIAWS